MAASVHLQSEQGIQHWIEVDGTGELFSCRSGFEIDPFHLPAFALLGTIPTMLARLILMNQVLRSSLERRRENYDRQKKKRIQDFKKTLHLVKKKHSSVPPAMPGSNK